ncbi:MAG TPA: glycosyltransferase family 2 protein [Acidimicrobiales bacterium]|nr:glycosyltransferase family 2 protein [Acidimicrobiales bacterium]
MPDVVLPVLNEAEALPFVLSRMPDGYRAIVVDNRSTDDSAAIAGELGALVVSEPRRGFGAACDTGLRSARDSIVCFMDADASVDPAVLPSLTAPLVAGDADLVIGARVPEPGAWPCHARLANRALAWELRRRTGLSITDLGPVRAVRREALLALDLLDRRFGWPVEMILSAARSGWRVLEVPVAYRSRLGRSKVTGTAIGTARAVRDMAAHLWFR